MSPENYVGMFGKILIVDIEAIRNENMLLFIQSQKAPGNYKTEAATQKFHDTVLEKAALDADYACLRCIGTGEHFDGLPKINLIHNLDEEKQALIEFWDYAKDFYIFGGYNIKNYDLPVLLRRSFALGVFPHRRINLSRSSKDFIDFMQLLYHEGYGPIQPSSQRWRGLKTVAKMYGIDNPLPDVDGSMVDTMSDEELMKYNANDIKMTQELARRTQGIYWGEAPIREEKSVNFG